MTFLALALLAAVALAPLALSLWRGGAGRARREAALTLHRAQLVELDRDRADGRLSDADHAAAILEVQRRLLSAADLPDTDAQGGRRAPLWAMLAVVPLAGAGLYLINGRPDLPGQPLAARVAQADREQRGLDSMIATLRDRIVTLDPNSDKARQGYLLLARAEDSRGRLAEAAAAWREATRIRFDPETATLAAEAQTRVDGGRISVDSAGLFARALAEGPPDAAWRGLAEQRLKESLPPNK